MVRFLLDENNGTPLSVAVKVTAKVAPLWLGLGVKENVAETGFPAIVEKLIPGTSPVASILIRFAGTSESVAIT